MLGALLSEREYVNAGWFSFQCWTRIRIHRLKNWDDFLMSLVMRSVATPWGSINQLFQWIWNKKNNFKNFTCFYKIKIITVKMAPTSFPMVLTFLNPLLSCVCHNPSIVFQSSLFVDGLFLCVCLLIVCSFLFVYDIK